MKLLFESTDRDEIYSTRILLESRGIPVFIGNEDSAINFGPLHPARNYSLWVYIDEQCEDALALLDNIDHEVRRPVDIEKYSQSLEQLSTQNRQKLFNGLMLALILAIALVVALAFMG
jgi:hypothetical protein